MLGYDDDEIPNDFSVWEKNTSLEDVEKSWKMQKQLINKEIDQFNLEFKMKHKDGHWIDILSRAEAVFDENGNALRIVGTHTDITERNKAEEQIRINEERLKVTLESAELGAWEWDIPTEKITFDNRWAEMLGYKKDEIENNLSSWEKFIHPDEIKSVNEILNKHLNREIDFYEAEYRMKHKNGNWIWILDKGKVIERDKEGNPIRMTGTHLDITHRKEAENELKQTQNQLRLLFANLANVREDERKVIARELHDELGQVLTSLNMNLSLLKNNVKNKLLDESHLISELEEMSKIIDESKVNIKNLIRSLRPEYLDNLGLIPALKYLVEDFSSKSKIDINFKYNFDELRIESDRENIIYRLVQESLTNIVKHANATIVNIIMELNNSIINLTIEDNGKGIESKDIEKTNSFGLLGMRERVAQIGGNLIIKGTSNKGTKLSVNIKV